MGGLPGPQRFAAIQVTQMPVTISGLPFPVTIYDSHMQIGCELHSIAEWAAFSDDDIGRMDPKEAKPFWRTYKDVLINMAKANQRF